MIIEQYIRESVEKINLEQLVKDEIDRRIQGRTLSLVEEIVVEGIENTVKACNVDHRNGCKCDCGKVIDLIEESN